MLSLRVPLRPPTGSPGAAFTHLLLSVSLQPSLLTLVFWQTRNTVPSVS